MWSVFIIHILRLFVLVTEFLEQCKIRLFFSLVIQFHAIRIHRQDRQFRLLRQHPLQRPVISPDHCRYRSPDHCCKCHIQLFCRICKFCNQSVVSSKDRIHITKPRTEYRTSCFKPSWLIESTYISRTAARITDDQHSAKFV